MGHSRHDGAVQCDLSRRHVAHWGETRATHSDPRYLQPAPRCLSAFYLASGRGRRSAGSALLRVDHSFRPVRRDPHVSEGNGSGERRGREAVLQLWGASRLSRLCVRWVRHRDHYVRHLVEVVSDTALSYALTATDLIARIIIGVMPMKRG